MEALEASNGALEASDGALEASDGASDGAMEASDGASDGANLLHAWLITIIVYLSPGHQSWQ